MSYLFFFSLSRPKLTSNLTFWKFRFMLSIPDAEASCWRVLCRSECSAEGVKEELHGIGGAISDIGDIAGA